MLNHLLAVIVEFGGLSLFLSGFFFPEVRRKSDFAWSGVALLYALVLWIEGDSTSGGALLGHIASVALILWFGWQALAQRRQFALPEDQTAIPGSLETLMPFLKKGWGRITIAYTETADWVQNQLGKEDSSTLPEVQAIPNSLQDANAEGWENSEPSSSSLFAEPSELSSTEPAEAEVTEAIAVTHPESATGEVSADTSPVAETLASGSDDKLDLTQEIPKVSPTPTVIQTQSKETEPSTVFEQQPSSDLESPAMSTTIKAPTTERVEISHDHLEISTESTSLSGANQQNEPYAEESEENTTVSIQEGDDGSWPPPEIP